MLAAETKTTMTSFPSSQRFNPKLETQSGKLEEWFRESVSRVHLKMFTARIDYCKCNTLVCLKNMADLVSLHDKQPVLS